MKKLLVIILGAVIAALLLTCIGCTKPKQALKQAPVANNITTVTIDHSKIYKAWKYIEASKDWGNDTLVTRSGQICTYYYDGTFQDNSNPKVNWKWVNDTIITFDISKINLTSYIYITTLNDSTMWFYQLNSNNLKYKYHLKAL